MTMPALSAVHDLHQISPNSKSGSRVPGERKPLSSHHNFAPVEDGLYLTIITALTPDTTFPARTLKRNNLSAADEIDRVAITTRDHQCMSRSPCSWTISRDFRRGCNKNPGIFVEQG
ncbi:hypothetical protein DER46DRAFT_568546 [Fusarium sp. MPI-SDFR-AT-0072]|nr:hypothetical protein DER46DRAFT_568546 [Fusarium sp. MPI-SDFR-AT-0072]